MIAAGLGEDEARKLIAESNEEGRAVVACINSPSSVTISGDADSVAKLQSKLEDQKIFNRKLTVKTAYHSPHMGDIASEYLAAIQAIKGVAANDSTTTDPLTTVRMFSSVTGDLVDDSTVAQPAYWVSNLVNPVRFSQAMQSALDYSPTKRRTTSKNAKRIDTIIEVGPHSALQGPIKQILAARRKKANAEVSYASILSRNSDARVATLEALGLLVSRGFNPDISRANNPLGLSTENMQLTDIPPTTWNRNTKYWHESPAAHAFRFRALPRHDLLGARSEYSSDVEPSWRNFLRVSEIPWIEQHQVQSSILYPFAGMIVMAVEAIRQVADTTTREIEGFQLRDVSAGAAIVVPHDSGGKEGTIETKVQLRPWRTGSRSPDHAWHEFTIASRSVEGHWTQNCTGLITVKYRASINSTFVDEAKTEATHSREEYNQLVTAKLPAVSVDEFYGIVSVIAYLRWNLTNLMTF